MLLAVAFGPLLWQVPINDIDFGAHLEGPSWSHPFGTDDLGQDDGARNRQPVPAKPAPGFDAG